MPLNLVDLGVEYTIAKICGKEEQRHYMESLGFVVNETVKMLSKMNDYYVVLIKGSKIGIDHHFAKMIIVNMMQTGRYTTT